jgi:sialate O-acetylesterase
MKLEKIYDSSFDSELRLPRLISDGMVLQRDTKVKIWGWAAPGGIVTVDFIEKSYSAITNPDGKWEVMLDELQAGGPYSMGIKARTSITVKNILVGDVWICSGQSNMVIPMERVKVIYEDEIANCENPAIRQFVVPDRYDFKVPQEDLEGGSWEAASADTILQFTAVGYFFAKALFEKYHMPIGLIRNSVGGTPVESWLSEDALKYFPENLEVIKQLNVDGYIDSIMKKEQADINDWFNSLNQNDKGLINGEPAWAEPSYEASDWSTMKLPISWEEEGLRDLKGALWFRKEIDVPASMIGKPAKLYMGTIVDSDSTYVNGTFVGSTGYQYPPRRYEVPANLLKQGKNIITLRVISNDGKGEFIKDKPYKLFTEDQVINLQGEWQYKIGAAVSEPLPPTTFFQYKPLGLFNGMIAPLLNYNMKGVIWYQGESNTGDPEGYHERFSAMIADWRQKWQQGSFPFLFVQLANFMEAKAQPSESKWAELREEQRRTLDVYNTGMAVAIDVGEWNDLHPLNKKDVGNRLSLLAQKIAYGDNEVVSSGPIYKSMKAFENRITIAFENIGGGLVVKEGDKLQHFAIAGLNNKFVWANAIIKEDKVVVWNDEVINPIAVRYAWADNPQGANLYNKEGLPASPFTTEK